MQMTNDEFEIPEVGRLPRISQGLLPSHLYIKLLNIIMSVLSLRSVFKVYGMKS